MQRQANAKSTLLDDLRRLLAAPEPPGLGPGPRAGVQTERALREAAGRILGQSPISAIERELVLALVLLWHDHLEPAHVIAQGVDNTDGAFVHGIMHRRELDFGNAKYWFHRVGQHPAFEEIARRVAALPAAAGCGKFAQRLVQGGWWDPIVMIDGCEQAAETEGADPLRWFLREAQSVETEVLLERFGT